MTAATTETASPAAIVKAPPTPDQGGAIDVFASASNFAVALRMATNLSQSSMVPTAYQGEAGIQNIMIAIELASRIGASVFAVMQNLDVIHGRPGWRATFLIATVNACGRFTPLRFRFQGTEGKPDWGCRAVAKDRETGEECVGALITLALAAAEGWSGKSGSKWKTMPEQMLCYRAAAFWTRVYAPELSLGMQTSDEVFDVGALPSVAVAAGAGATSTARAIEAALVGGPAKVVADPSTGELPHTPGPERDPVTGEIVPPEVGK